jgi:hypothetical protein
MLRRSLCILSLGVWYARLGTSPMEESQFPAGCGANGRTDAVYIPETVLLWVFSFCGG